MKLSPVVIFSYNRVDKIERCLNHLEQCDEIGETELFIFSDGAQNDEVETQVKAVRALLQKYASRTKAQKVNIIYQPTNKGLKRSIIDGVTEILKTHESVIVLEDDLVVAGDFLKYMNAALLYYRDKKKYGSVCAYSYPIKQLKHYKKDVYVTLKGDCWGWGTWNDRWDNIDWEFSDYSAYYNDWLQRLRFNSLEYGLDKLLLEQRQGEGSSWAVLWIYHLFKNNLLSVYPKVSRCKNIGTDGSGEHCEEDDKYDCKLSTLGDDCLFEELEVNRVLARACAKYPRRSLLSKLNLKLSKFKRQ